MHYLIIDTCVWIDLARRLPELRARLIELVNQRKVTLLVPRIVIDEWNRHKEDKIVTTEEKSILGKVKNAKTISEYLPPEDAEQLKQILDRFNREPEHIRNLVREDVDEIDGLLNHESTVQLPITEWAKLRAVDFALEKKAPFDDKNSMADALIIFSLIDYVAQNNIAKSIFVSTNTRDFSAPNKAGIHEDLKDVFDEYGVQYYVNIGRALQEIEAGIITNEEINKVERTIYLGKLHELAEALTWPNAAISEVLEAFLHSNVALEAIWTMQTGLIMEEALRSITASSAFQEAIRSVQSDPAMEEALRSITANSAFQEAIRSVQSDPAMEEALRSITAGSAFQEAIRSVQTGPAMEEALRAVTASSAFQEAIRSTLGSGSALQKTISTLEWYDQVFESIRSVSQPSPALQEALRSLSEPSPFFQKAIDALEWYDQVFEKTHSISQPNLALQEVIRSMSLTSRAWSSMSSSVESTESTEESEKRPSLAKVPAEYRPELEALEAMSDEKLWEVVQAEMPGDHQDRLEELLQKNQSVGLSEEEEQELDQLHAEADRLMLRKSYAQVILKWRGHAVPKPADS